jgi:alkanesulfonate monooxygenase SsuD/methylene tetrahydromethanopterin reductase-like flavin-dependent oxidoreductase (luciferase family)
MRFGLHVPQLGALGEPGALVELAQGAEGAGWDGVFLWDHLMHAGDPAACDPWVALGTIAATTARVQLGPLVTPLPRRRPWKVAREAMTLDRLSQGRAVLGVGIGTDAYREFSAFGEEANDDRTRGARLDEALTLITDLWLGERVHHAGRHWSVDDVVQTPTPAQSPRVPIWCAAIWPHRAPVQRAARWDGIVPVGRLTPDDATALLAEVRRERTQDAPFDLVVPSAAATVGAIGEYGAAGATWWLESLSPSASLMQHRAVVEAGPPRA